MTIMDEVSELLKEIASINGEYETEYDGRMYSYCVSCNYDENTPHSKDCVFVKAKMLHDKIKGK